MNTSQSGRIAIFLPSLRGGGAERVMVTLANGFAARGYCVDLVLVRAEGPYLAEVEQQVRIVDLDKGRVLESILPLACYLRRERPVAMLSALNHANITAILARLIAKVPLRLVVSERNSLADHPTTPIAKIIRILMRWLYPRADGVIAVSRAMKSELVSELGLSPDRIAFIPNPVDLISLNALAQTASVHPWLEPDGPPLILAVGRLERQKGYDLLLEALARLRSKREIRLIILGEGSQRTQLEQQISALGLKGAVDLPGFKPNPFGWMAACDLFVLTSRYEGFPNVLVQAMACGKRVVSTDCPTGPHEILEGGRWGRLVPLGDAEALANAISEVLDDPAPPDVRSRAEEFRSEIAIDAYEHQLIGCGKLSGG